MNQDIPLVVLDRTYAGILKQYQGPKFIVSTPNPGFEETAIGLTDQKGSVDQGGSVAHLNFSLAHHMGCNPITFIGQDLSLTQNSHFEQVDAGGKIEVVDGNILWSVTDPNSHLTDQVSSMGPAQYVPGYFGNVVLTNIGLVSFITAFENMIKNTKNTIYNCTEGGVKLKGTKQCSLQKYLNKFCNTKINKSVINPLLSLANNADELIEKVIPLLKKDIKLFNNIIKNTKKGITFADEMLIEKDEEKLKNLMFLNEKYSNLAHNQCKKNPLIGVALYKMSRKIHTREIEVKGDIEHILKNEDDFKTRIERNKMILNEANNYAKEFKKLYNKTLKILQKYQETKDESLLTEKEKFKFNGELAEKYLAEGNWVFPY
jgi:hypothetical protein